jgi:hypothetical protein
MWASFLEPVTRKPSACAIVSAVQEGDVLDLERLLEENSTLAGATIVDAGGCQRSLPHMATDYGAQTTLWQAAAPGRPTGWSKRAAAQMLLEHGADRD